MSDEAPREPLGDLTTRTVAMPADTNPAGDIFGGWVLSQMDIAGNLVSKKRAGGRTVTVALDGMIFHKPVLIGDTLACYTKILRVGTTSITVNVEAWVIRQYGTESVRVTEGKFTFVAVDKNRNPRPVDQEEVEYD